jgi:hypothetical protein
MLLSQTVPCLMLLHLAHQIHTTSTHQSPPTAPGMKCITYTFRKRLLSTATLTDAASAAAPACSRPSLHARALLTPRPIARRLWS